MLQIQIQTPAIKTGMLVPLISSIAAQKLAQPCLIALPDVLLAFAKQAKVGALFSDATETPLFRYVGKMLLAVPQLSHAQEMYYCEALYDEPEARTLDLTYSCEGFALAWVTLSDKGFCGQRKDLSGPSIGQLLHTVLPLRFEQGFMLPDEAGKLSSLLLFLAEEQKYDIIFTTGGTGVSARDVTPEATLAVIEKRLAGLEEAMRAASFTKTPHALISRAVAGTIGETLVVNLPGSKKGVEENLAVILPGLLHLLQKLQGCQADCGS